jgi:polar amino acid transport system substrate-binding protein
MNALPIALSAFFMAMVAFTACLPLPSAMAVTLHLATDDTPGTPWIMGDGVHFQTGAPGAEIELYQHMAKRLDLELSIIRLPWKRCLAELKNGRIDGVFPASFKPERLLLGVYPMRHGKVDPHKKSRDSAYHLYTPEGSPLAWNGRSFINMHQLDRQTIGVPLGWSIATDLDRMGVDILEKPRPVDLLTILGKGGIAGVVCLDTVIDAYLAQAPDRFRKIHKVYPPVVEKAYYLLLSHAFVETHATLATKIWDTIAEIKKEPVFKVILERYTR